jgi:alkaline phosphatase D
VHSRNSARPHFSERRRGLLQLIGSAAVLGAAPGALVAPARAAEPAGLFTLGIASGDPSHDGFVLWTRLAPRPFEPGGGMPAEPVEVRWTIAADEAMRRVVRESVALARPESVHTVHVEVNGLEPAREYFYRFSARGERSTVGRATTLPSPGSKTAVLRFAAAGCQRYEDGHYHAWRHIAGERCDFVFHYGDYIYEYTVPPERARAPIVRTVPGVSGEARSLDEYRARYAAYKLDPDLQAAHAAAPFIVSFDDHEVRNNWAGDYGGRRTPRDAFRIRRAAAFQAWYEHMPLRSAQRPRGPDILAHRRIVAGDLVAMHVLDTRQHRSPPACGGGLKSSCPEAFDTSRTMLGEAQEQWLYAGLRARSARWTVLAQQVPLMPRNVHPEPGQQMLELDKWAGAAAARTRLLRAVKEAKAGPLIVVTGDVHHNCIGELKEDFADEASAVLGAELIGTSISSGGDGSDTTPRLDALVRNNPHIKFCNNQRGYIRHVVTPERWQADLRVLDKVSVAEGRVSTRRSFVVESGEPGMKDG